MKVQKMNILKNILFGVNYDVVIGVGLEMKYYLRHFLHHFGVKKWCMVGDGLMVAVFGAPNPPSKHVNPQSGEVTSNTNNGTPW